MIDELRTALLAPTGVPLPGKYVELMLCREFRCLPHQLREMPADDYRFILDAMQAEGEAGRVRDEMQDFLRRHA